jgi:hypothetical protein
MPGRVVTYDATTRLRGLPSFKKVSRLYAMAMRSIVFRANVNQKLHEYNYMYHVKPRNALS